MTNKLIVLLLLTLNGLGQKDSNFVKEANEKSSLYFHARDFESKYNLDQIENGFDSLQIRIWYYCGKCGSPQNVFIIKRLNGVWSPQVGSSQSKSVTTLTSSDINKFMEKLLSFEILTLPSMREISGLSDGYADGDMYVIETASQSKYRLYYYHLPKKFKRFREVKQFLRAVKLIKTEFKIPLADED